MLERVQETTEDVLVSLRLGGALCDLLLSAPCTSTLTYLL